MDDTNVRFLVLNREKAEEHTSQLRRYAVISITDCGSQEAKLKESPHRVAVLRLQFSDVDADRHPIVRKYGNDPLYKRWIEVFSDKYAEQIFNFYSEHKDEVDYFLIHCEAGISRSPAVAATLCFYETGNDEYFFAKFLPNRYIYRTILDFLDKGGHLHNRVRIKRDLSPNGLHPSVNKIIFTD